MCTLQLCFTPTSSLARIMSNHQNYSASPQGSSPPASSYAPGGPRRGGEGRGGGATQRYGDSARNTRGGGAFAGASERRPPYSTRGGGGPALSEDANRTKLASYVTPHDAVQDQPAQHGATIVRSGSAATEGGSILFFSSVQKKGGAFTASERETYAQLRQSRAIPTSSRSVRGGGSVVGSGIQTRNVGRQFDELEKTREAQALSAVRSAVVATKRSRFTLDSDGDESDSEDTEKSYASGEETREARRPRGEAVADASSSDSDDA